MNNLEDIVDQEPARTPQLFLKRWRAARDFWLTHVSESRVNLDTWDFADLQRLPNSCGTRGCIAGWLSCMPEVAEALARQGFARAPFNRPPKDQAAECELDYQDAYIHALAAYFGLARIGMDEEAALAYGMFQAHQHADDLERTYEGDWLEALQRMDARIAELERQCASR